MANISSYWSKMTPDERSAEMKRRQAVRKRKYQSNPDPARERLRERWRRQARKQREKKLAYSTESPFPNEVKSVSLSSGTIKQRIEALEAALAALKADIGL